MKFWKSNSVPVFGGEAEEYHKVKLIFFNPYPANVENKVTS